MVVWDLKGEEGNSHADEKQMFGKQIVGAAPAGLHALCFPSLKTREKAWSQRWRQKHHWFNGWRILHV